MVALGVGVRETVAVAGRTGDADGLTAAMETGADPSTLLRGVKVASAMDGGAGSARAGAPQAEKIKTDSNTNKKSLFMLSPIRWSQKSPDF
jgi:hypothetical protein